MKAIYRFSLLLSICAIPFWGQAQSYGRMFHAYVGLDALNTSVINNWLPDGLGYADLENGTTSIGIDGFAVRRNVLIGGQLQVKHGSLVHSQAGNLRPYVVDVMLQTGYILSRKKGLIVYTTLGAGYGAFGAHIFNTRKHYPEFVPSQVAIRENVVLIQQGLVGSLALGADYCVGKRETERTKGLVLGIRVGYDARPSSNRWQANEATLSDGPTYSASGAFVRLTIGMASVGPK